MRTLIICVLSIMFTGCAGGKIIQRQFAPAYMVHNNQVGEVVATRSLNAKDINNYILYLNKGDSFPLELIIDSEIIGIQPQTVNIVARQKLYFMMKVPEDMTNKELEELEEKVRHGKLSEMSTLEQMEMMRKYKLYASNDGATWAPLSNMKAVKKVFGIKRGNFSFGMGVDSETGLWSKMEINTMHSD